MATLVLKFGGTSVADLNYIKHAAKIIAQEAKRGNKLIVVVSAMSGETNKLLDYCQTIGDVQDAREVDVVLSSGEQVTSALMAMAIQNLGFKSRSFLGWQIPLKTSNLHMNAQIDEIDTEIIDNYMEEGGIAVVPGFQGVSDYGRITTLGRGGSDLTAVALAAAFDAQRCDIYTDVSGIYFCDPKLVKDGKAKKLDEVTYDEIIEMSSYGAKVMQYDSVSYAKSHDVIVQVLSTFGESIGSDLKGTFILNEKKATSKNFLSAFVMNEKVMGYEFQISKDQLESLTQMIRLHESGIKLSVCEKRSGEYGYKIYFSMEVKNIFEPFFQANNIPYKAIKSLVECIFIGSNLFEHKAGLEKISSLLLKAQLNQNAILYADSKISVIVSNDNKARLIDVVCSELMT